MHNRESDKSPLHNNKDFQTTQWSLILHAAQHESPESQAALAALCEAYWFPLYAYARRRTKDQHTAQDLTQGFFAHLLDKRTLAKTDSKRGRFRSFLLTAFKNYMANEWHKAHSEKRGGHRQTVSLDFTRGETRFRIEPAISVSPDRAFDRQWVMTVLDRVLDQLRKELCDRGQADAFEELKGTLTEQTTASQYQSIAQKLDMTPAGAKQAAYRLRQRYRQLFRDEVSRTVEDDSEMEDEISRLLAALAE